MKRTSYNYGTFYFGQDNKWHYLVKQITLKAGDSVLCERHVSYLKNSNYKTLVAGLDMPFMTTQGMIVAKLQELNNQ